MPKKKYSIRFMVGLVEGPLDLGNEFIDGYRTPFTSQTNYVFLWKIKFTFDGDLKLYRQPACNLPCH